MANGTMARCVSAARQTGYKVRGCSGIDIMRPDRAIALFQLSHGALVVVLDGEKCDNHWRRTYREADELFWSLRRAMIEEGAE